jgi:phage N-6-adenine-methyltransferase
MTLVKNELTIFAAELDFDAGRFTPTGWEPPNSLTYDQWGVVGQRLQQAEGALNWLLGDWLNEGERRYGETYMQAVEATGHKIDKLYKCRWVANSIQFCKRLQNLSWTHHHHVSHLDEDAQQVLLAYAAEHQLSSRELLEAVREYEGNLRQVGELPEPPQVYTNGHNADEYDPIFDPPTSNRVYYMDSDEADRIAADLHERHYTVTDEWGTEETINVGGATAYNNHAISDSPGYDGDEWYTPPEYTDAACLVMGNIDLDPASCAEAQKVIQASTYYTKEDDALRPEVAWTGRVWLNPPYSMPLIKQFVSKLIDEYDAGNVTEAIIITNNSSDTAWFHSLLERFPACFTYGRVHFWRPNHEDFGTRQGQTLFYLGDNVQRFREVFGKFGQVVAKI